MPRIARAINSGLGFFAIGSRDVLCDWVHADNLVQALLLAGASLTENAPAGRGGCQGEPEAAGQAFFINDGAPINNFAFLRQVFAPPGSAASASLFWLRVPSSAMYTFAAAAEVLHRAAGRWLALDPFLTKAEVCKVGYTHYMTTARAERILGYRPVLDPQEGLQRTREFFAPLVRQRPSRVLSGMALATPFAALLLLITSMVLRAR